MLRREVLNLGVLTHWYYWGDGYSVNRLGSGYYPWYYSGDEWFAAECCCIHCRLALQRALAVGAMLVAHEEKE
jgi:hypothetical protein